VTENAETPPGRHRIVIVGGGAGGLPLATALGDKLARRGMAEVTLVDRAETHVWKPLLHEVAAGRMDAAAHDVDYLAVAYWHRFRFRQGTVEGLSRARRELEVGSVVDDDGRQILPKDYLLDATDWHRQPDAFAPRKAKPYFGYGYQFWLFPGEKRRFALLGVYGQSIFVDPELKLVMVITAAAKNASVGKESLARERDALWRGVVARYGSW